MKTFGFLLIIIGVVGLLFFGFQAMQDSESFSFLGLDIAVSSANWTPVVGSGAVFIIGLILAARRK
ncbi:hypothetical protein A3SI_08241 [Nitritalea halalkaliphila LW7]|uniref:Transglycosylase n=1 Tax=Nitritalea halalkaliphila LW7 TaxID=1189621 RepID=I5C512_9BACT|nr:hypothetical protein [Nitritalea halalkaliphila]EIM76914.1 hypothetical protein A3SI_08241 [Nitritalea halalkaliphila LW7]